MTHKYSFCVLFMLVIVSVGLAACQPTVPPFVCEDSIGCIEIASGESLKLGVLQPISGGMADVGTDQIRGIELALAARDNQVLGHSIELQIEDSRCTSEGGTIAAMKVVADRQVVAILGTTCSGAATTAARIMSEAGLVMVSGANTAPSLTAIGGKPGSDWQPGYFRISTNDAVVAEAVATFVFRELGKTQAAVINDGDVYTRGFTEVFEQAFTALGGEIVLSAAINKGDEDMQPVLDAVVLSEAEIIFFPIFPPEADRIVLQAAQMPDLDAVTLLGGGALLKNSFIQSVGEAGVGLYVAGRTPPKDPDLDELSAAYAARYGELPHTSTPAFAFDATNLLLHGIDEVAVQAADGTLYIGRQALRDALYATTNLMGVSSAFGCDQFGDCSTELSKIMLLNDPNDGLEGLLSNVVYTHSQNP